MSCRENTVISLSNDGKIRKCMICCVIRDTDLKKTVYLLWDIGTL